MPAQIITSQPQDVSFRWRKGFGPGPEPGRERGEVAEVLRVSAPTVYRLAKRDPTLPVLRLPGLMRFPRERLLRWLRDREQGQGRPRGIGGQATVPRKTTRDHAGSQT
ncbi:MAG: hypothetical protein DME12_08225 [Candidatus Rokuibacteriota bacterium]|nr:MAG: hypothetical protein DME12_08225 [Candidatus Rokubacteria bacterium]